MTRVETTGGPPVTSGASLPGTGPGTSSPRGARAHARSQGGTVVRAMPTLPASAAEARPPGVGREQMVWEEVIDPGQYATHPLARGTVLRLVDVDGEAAAHVLVHNLLNPGERLCPADTVKVQWQAYVTAGTRLLSDMGRVLLTVTEDTSGHHDALCAPPNRADHQRKYGNGTVEGPFPNARDRLVLGALKAGLQRRDVGPGITFFKGARVGPDGSLALDLPPEPLAGASVTLRCEMDVSVVLANVPHVLDDRPGYVCSPLRVTAWTGPDPEPGAPDPGVAAPWDPAAGPGPEVLRAHLNTEAWLAGRGIR